MGTNTLVSKSDGQIISSSDVNQYRTALNENIVPRNSSGVPTDQAGDLGSTTYGFDDVYAEQYNIGDTADGLYIKNSGSQIAFGSSGINRTVIGDNGLDGSGIKDLTVATAKIQDNGVTTVKIANSNVTTAKIADLNVTTAKIVDSNITTAKIADSNVTTAKIADLNVTPAKKSVFEFENPSTGAWSTSSTSDTTIGNGAIVLNHVGRSIKFEVLPDFTTNSSRIYTTGAGGNFYITLYRDTTKIDELIIPSPIAFIPNIIFHTNNESTSHTYSVKARVSVITDAIYFTYMRLVATLL